MTRAEIDLITFPCQLVRTMNSRFSLVAYSASTWGVFDNQTAIYVFFGSEFDALAECNRRNDEAARGEELYSNEDYYLELIANNSPVEPRTYFHRSGPHYVAKWPFTKDNAIRAFMRRKAAGLKEGETLELWRETPALVCCIRATNKRIQVLPDVSEDDASKMFEASLR